MKKCLWVIALCLLSSPALGFEINAGISGSWHNPDRDGHGFAVEYTDLPGACEQIDGQGCLVVYWFVYDKEGDPIFLLGSLPVDGHVAEGDLSYFNGLEFGSFAPKPTVQPWGSLRLRFTDCRSGNARFESGFEPLDGAAFDEEGSFKIRRLAYVAGLDCSRAERLATMPESPVGGVWTGQATSEDFSGSRVRSLVMVADADSNAWIFGPSPELFFQGSLEGEGASVAGTLDAKAVLPGELFDGSRTGTTDFEMDGRAGYFLRGSFSGQGVEAEFNLAYQPESQRPATMERLGRCWGQFQTFSGRGAAEAFQIAGDGAFDIQLDDDGCRITGNAGPAGEAWGLYRASATVSACDEHDGEYEGVMTIFDFEEHGDDLALLVALEGEEASLTGSALLQDSGECQ